MESVEIGVDVDDLRLGPREGLREAAEMRFRAVELLTVAGEVKPENLSTSGRRHLARYVEGLGLRLAALRADLPALRLTDPAAVHERTERTCRVLELARDLKVPAVTASFGALTHPETGEPSSRACQALARIGEVADGCDLTFNLRPAYDNAERIARVLDRLQCAALRVCLDPAESVMTGCSPMSFLERIAEQVTLVHVRDGTIGRDGRGGREVPLGEGDVDWIGLLAALGGVDYSGPYILRCTGSPRPAFDLTEARRAFIQQLPPGRVR